MLQCQCSQVGLGSTSDALHVPTQLLQICANGGSMPLDVFKWQWLQRLTVTYGQPKVCQLLVQFIILALQYLLLSLPLLLLCYLLCTPLLPQHLLDHTKNLMHQLGVVLACTC